MVGGEEGGAESWLAAAWRPNEGSSSDALSAAACDCSLALQVTRITKVLGLVLCLLSH